MTLGVTSKKNLLKLSLVMAAIVFFMGQKADAGTKRWVNNNASTYVAPGKNCVDAGYVTIQDAVNAAVSGDLVSVCPGTYVENVTIGTNNVRVVSVGGPAVTIVNAATTFYVFQITASVVTIDGFTIVPTGTADADIAVHLAVAGNANARILHNIITGGRLGINLGCASDGSTIAHNTLKDQSEAAINIDTCEGSESGSDGNFVHHNSACGGGFAYSIAAGEKSENNKIVHNVAIYLTVSGTGNNVHHNIAEYLNIAAGNTNHHNYLDPDACP